MTRTFYDSTNVADLPAGGDGYLAYADGNFANYGPTRRRFPGDVVVPITVNGSTPSMMADVETGDLTPTSAARWAKAQRARDGQPRTLYFPLSWHPQVLAACKAEGLKPGRDVLFFAARYGADQSIPVGFVGVQWLSPDGPAGVRPRGHFDESSVATYWLGVDPRPAFARLRYGKRRTARQLTRELNRRRRPVGAADRTLLETTAAAIRRVLGK